MGETKIDKEVERLAAHFHSVYQREAKRQGDVRHKDVYANLPENIKEFDRVLAREVLRMIHNNEINHPLFVSLSSIEKWCKENGRRVQLCGCGYKGDVVQVHNLISFARKECGKE